MLIEVTGWAGYPNRETRSRLNRLSGPTELISSPSKQKGTEKMLQSGGRTPDRAECSYDIGMEVMLIVHQ